MIRYASTAIWALPAATALGADLDVLKLDTPLQFVTRRT